MGAAIEVGTEISPITKNITQAKIDLFEACGLPGDISGGFHTDPEAALRTLRLATPIASGRMQLSFVAEALRKLFGTAVFAGGGSLDLRFTKPVVHGDAITVRGRISKAQCEEHGMRVSLDLWCENQDREKTAIGTGGVFIPN